MNTFRPLALASLLAVVSLVGCESSPRGGGMASDDSFNLIVPDSQLALKQGAVQTIDVTLRRGDQFKQDVKLNVKATPGITVDPVDSVIKASARPDAQVRVTAGKDVAIGEYRVTITATPTTGQSTMSELRVNVLPR